MTKIKRIIEESRMTQKDFANHLNIPLRTVENWSAGSSSCAKYLEDLIEYKMLLNIFEREDVNVDEVADIKFCVEFSNNDECNYFENFAEAKSCFKDYCTDDENCDTFIATGTEIHLEMILLDNENSVIKTLFLDKYAQ